MGLDSVLTEHSNDGVYVVHLDMANQHFSGHSCKHDGASARSNNYHNISQSHFLHIANTHCFRSIGMGFCYEPEKRGCDVSIPVIKGEDK